MSGSPAPKRVQFLMSGIHPALFTCDVDQYFTCHICWFIVQRPVACQNCENLYCKQCIQKYRSLKDDKCLFCHQHLTLNTVRKFPLKIYNQLTQFCQNYNHGCRFQGTIQEVKTHLLDCGYKMLQCISHICSKQYLQADQEFEAQVCSRECLQIYGLSQILGTANSKVYLKYFMNCLEAFRVSYVEDIENQAENLRLETKDKIKRLVRDNEALRQEIDSIKEMRHHGKFSNMMWTCCGQEKLSVGCSVIK